ETHAGNRCHSTEDEQTVDQGPELVIKPRILVSKDKENEQDRAQADADGNAGPQNDSCNNGQWTHSFKSRRARIEIPGLANNPVANANGLENADDALDWGAARN